MGAARRRSAVVPAPSRRRRDGPQRRRRVVAAGGALDRPLLLRELGGPAVRYRGAGDAPCSPRARRPAQRVVAGDLQQRPRCGVAGLDAHHLHRLDPRRHPSGGAGHSAVAVHRGLPRRRPRLAGDQPARGDPARGPGHPDAHRRRGHDRVSAGPSAHLRAVLRAAAGRVSRRRSSPPLAAARPPHRPGPRHPRRPRGGDRLHRRAPCDPLLFQRARSRAGREGPPVPGARRERLPGPAAL